MNCINLDVGGDVPAVDTATNIGEAGHLPAAALSFDDSVAALTRWLSFLLDPAPTTITQLCILGADRKPGAVSVAWIDSDPIHRARMAKMAIAESKRATLGAFAIANPIDPKLHERSPNELRSPPSKAEKAKGGKKSAFKLTEDADILSRRFVILDVDPVRPADTMATETEKAAAAAVVDRVRTLLKLDSAGDDGAGREHKGWPAPAVVDSGNGFHVYYRIDTSFLPVGAAYDAATDPLHELLTLLAAEFDTPAAKVDVRVYNPGRIIKLPYTWVRKGKATAERPHRIASVVSWAPDDAETNVITGEQFAVVLAELRRRHPGVKVKVPKAEGGAGQPTAAKTKAAKSKRPSAADIESRAIEYLKTIDPGIQGADGNSPTFRAARVVVWEFDLGVERGLALLIDHYNPRCVPPWSEEELRKLCEAADKKSFGKPRGHLLVNEYEAGAVSFGAAGGQPVPSAPPGDSVDPLLATPTEFDEKDDDPHRLARNFISERPAIPVVFWANKWYTWDADNRVYRKTEDTALRSDIIRVNRRLFEGDAKRRSASKKDGELVRVQPVNMAITSNVIDVLRSMPGVLIPSIYQPPMAIADPFLIDLERAFVAKSSIINLRAAIDSPNDPSAWHISPRDQTIFTVGGSEAEFDPAAPQPVKWLKFLNEVLVNNQAKIDRLQEWFGYCLTHDTDLHKILFLLGPSGSGKGTILHVFSKVIGESNICSFQIGKLGGRFALEPFIGKTVAICADARINRHSATAEALATVLQISGQDRVNVEGKGVTGVDLNLYARLVCASNELPHFRDAAAALARRVLPIICPVNFDGREDRGLRNRICKEELSSILMWAVRGWERIKAEKKFTATIDDAKVKNEIRNSANDLNEFVEDCCVVSAEASISQANLFAAYLKWADDTNTKATNRGWFSKRLEKAVESITVDRSGWNRSYVVHGIRLADL